MYMNRFGEWPSQGKSLLAGALGGGIVLVRRFPAGKRFSPNDIETIRDVVTPIHESFEEYSNE